MSLTRRHTLTAAVALAAGGAFAAPAPPDPAAARPRDLAPSAADAEAWSAYETRLRARIADGGGGRFDDAGARLALRVTNQARQADGAPELAWHDELATAARAHAADLAARGYVEHLSPEGFDPSHRFWLLARTTIGSPSENIAFHGGGDGPSTAAQLAGQWRRSPGHWRNLLRPTHTHAAYGLARRGDRAWLVGLYARPLAVLPQPLPFHARGPEVGQALRSLSSDLRPRVSIPQGSRMGDVSGAPPVMQITAIRREDTGLYDVIGGPIFLAVGTA